MFGHPAARPERQRHPRRDPPDQAPGIQPAHAEDQLGPYTDLLGGYPALADGKIDAFFGDASFGGPAGRAASTLRPAGRMDVAVRDRKTGVPHLTGTTRYGTECRGVHVPPVTGRSVTGRSRNQA